MADEQHMIVTPEFVKVVAAWCKGVQTEEIDPFDSTKRYPALNVPTNDGAKRASLGDYVIKKEDGSFDVVTALDYAALGIAR
jgi:hypothetical protein